MTRIIDMQQSEYRAEHIENKPFLANKLPYKTL